LHPAADAFDEGGHRGRGLRPHRPHPAQGPRGHRDHRQGGGRQGLVRRWPVAGEQGLASYWLDIHVSEGTNTKDEKAAYLAAMFERMGELLGPLHLETYLHVDEVRADAYGFGGLTQEQRYIAGKLGRATQAAAA
jgi:phenylpyruvate tautomerase PptA (4-oxalocrotonate tautomerase family)